MALNPIQLAEDMTSAELSATPGIITPDGIALITQKNLAIATAIHQYLILANVTVTVSPGIAVATAGSAAAQVGTTTGAGVGLGSLT